MGRCWVRPAGMLSPRRTQLSGWFRRKFQNRTSPDQVNVPPPPPTLAANVPTSGGGGGAYVGGQRPHVRWGGGGAYVGLRRPPCEGTLARYIAVVPPSHLKGPLLQETSVAQS
jgi:hypothetical protein